MTSAAKNYALKKKVERKIQDWIAVNNTRDAGHTHRPSCPRQGAAIFQYRSCVHPTCITCIEIVNGEITLIMDGQTDDDRSLFIDREPIAKPKNN